MDSTPSEKSISKEQINQLPLYSYEGEIAIIETLDQAEESLKELSLASILGFDTEAKPTFQKSKGKNPTSLVQLASPSKVHLFRLGKIGFPEGLKTLLESPSITKVGVAPNDDIKDLQKISPFMSAGFVDISKLAGELKISNRGLRGLAALLLNVRVSKSAKLSNWDNKSLTPSQISYAATDAWISFKVYEALINLKTKNLPPSQV